MRFAFDARTGASGKLHNRVSYPLNLRMKPSWLSFSPGSSSSAGFANAPASSDSGFGRHQTSSPPQTPKREYRLVATVSHHGQGAARGHYTAAVRLRDEREREGEEEVEESKTRRKGKSGSGSSGDGTKKDVSFRSPLIQGGKQTLAYSSSRWLSFDDDRVREVCEDEVTDGGAYLLFYELA
jgi:hypothetical protein